MTMKLMLVLYLLSLSMTASCIEAPVPDEGTLVLTGIRDHDKEIWKTTETVLGQDADSIRHITLSLDNREVKVRIVPDERERPYSLLDINDPCLAVWSSLDAAIKK
jgi:hypothetical protein